MFNKTDSFQNDYARVKEIRQKKRERAYNVAQFIQIT